MTLKHFLSAGEPIIRIELSEVRGSAPRDAGTEMLASATRTHGTIGGGRLELTAIEGARQLLQNGGDSTILDIPLGPEIGQCCGGRVSLVLTRMSDADRSESLRRADAEMNMRPHIYILGSGHVGRAIANQLQHLPFRGLLIDSRETELARCEAAVETRLTAIPEHEISTAPRGTAFVVTTHDHALDFLLTAAALERHDAAYVGLIGSATKRAKFEAWLRAQSTTANIGSLTCPIGTAIKGDKRPEIIAAFVTAEITAALQHESATPAQHADKMFERRKA